MVNNYLFYYISWFNKKTDPLKGFDEYCYYAAAALVGWTLAVCLYAVVNVVCIAVLQSKETYGVISNVMSIICFIFSLLSFLYYRYRGRWDIIYEKLQHSQKSQKIRYGFICILYVLSAYGTWFFTNDIIRVLISGNGTSMAIKTVETLQLTNWA